jgi:thiol-disulfide isomerase/thioredoxin
MKSILLILISFLISTFTLKDTVPRANSESMVDSDIMVVDFKQLQPFLEIDNDTIYVVNFWATWCGPCVREIPYFEQLRDKYEGENLKIVMVSLDMSDDLDTRVIPFMRKYDMKNKVLLLDDPQSNRWIPLVDEKWDIRK